MLPFLHFYSISHLSVYTHTPKDSIIIIKPRFYYYYYLGKSKLSLCVHRRMVEEIEIIMILVVVFMGIFTAFNLIRPQNPVKKARKSAEISLFDNLTDYREVEKATISDILKQKESQIKSLNARIKQFEPETDEEPQKKGVTWEEIQALVKTQYPKYAVVLPIFKKQILDATKGMSMEEILNYVKEVTGNQQPQGSADPQSTQYNPNWA